MPTLKLASKHKGRDRAPRKTSADVLYDKPRNYGKFASTMHIPVEPLAADAPRHRSAFLEMVSADGHTQRIMLGVDEAIIGRDPDANIAIPSPNVSRHHARIVWKNEKYVVQDMQSTNGTFVNGVRVNSCVLHGNDNIQIGKAVIRYVES